MIYAAVFDNDNDNFQTIKELFTKYTIQEDTDIDTIHFFGNITEDKIQRYASDIPFALVSLDMENGKEIGEAIYRNNTNCRILYYGKEKGDLEPLLCSRPIAHHALRSGKEALFDKIKEIILEISNATDTFRFETKRLAYFFPYRDILYFQSDLKYVNICKSNKRTEMIYAKLSEIEEKLGHVFVRIHKSYIVNRSYIDSIDKKSHKVIMKNGEELPISDAQYKNVVEKLGFFE